MPLIDIEPHTIVNKITFWVWKCSFSVCQCQSVPVVQSEFFFSAFRLNICTIRIELPPPLSARFLYAFLSIITLSNVNLISVVLPKYIHLNIIHNSVALCSSYCKLGEYSNISFFFLLSYSQWSFFFLQYGTWRTRNTRFGLGPKSLRRITWIGVLTNL